jgi:hypothetical protein
MFHCGNFNMKSLLNNTNTQDGVGQCSVHETFVQVTDLWNGTVRIQLDLTLPWAAALNLLCVIPIAGKDGVRLRNPRLKAAS